MIDPIVVRGAKMHFQLRSNSVPSSDNSFKGRRAAFLLLPLLHLLWHEKSICHEMQEGLSSGLRRRRGPFISLALFTTAFTMVSAPFKVRQFLYLRFELHQWRQM